MGIRLVPDAHRSVDLAVVERHVDELREAVNEEQRRDGVGWWR